MTDKQLIYITASSESEATEIGRALVSERLVACVNIHAPIKSVYWWDGDVQEDAEVALVAKTTEDLVPRVIERVKAAHSYDCPCVVALPIAGGNPAFLEWISKETT